MSYILENSNFIGTVLNSTFTNSLPSGWANYNANPTFNNGMILQGGNGNVISQFVYHDKFTASLNWAVTLEFTLNTIPIDSTGGIFSGRRSVNGTFPIYAASSPKRITGTTWGVRNIIYNSIINQFEASLSTNTVQMTVGAKYRLYITCSNTTMYSKLSRVDNNGLELESCNTIYNFSKLATDYKQPPNTGGAWIGSLGGNYTVTSYKEEHFDEKEADIVYIGDSIGVRYDANLYSNHFVKKIFEGTNKKIVNLSGGGDGCAEVLMRMQEIYDLKPKAVLLGIGTNDSFGTISTNLPLILDGLIANNIPTYFLVMFGDLTKISTAITICKNKNIKVINPQPFIDVPTMLPDLIHYNDLGFQKIADVIRAELPEITGYTGQIELASSGSSSVNIIANSTPIVSGTSGRIPFNNGGVYAETSNLFWDDVNGTMGIRTSSPQTGLDIASDGLRVQGIKNPTSGTGIVFGYYALGSYGIARCYDSTLGAYKDFAFGKDDNQLFLKGTGSIGINTQSPNNSAILDINSTNKGFLPPRMTTSERDAISSPASGLIIFNTTTNKLNVFTTIWEQITSS